MVHAFIVSAPELSWNDMAIAKYAGRGPSLAPAVVRAACFMLGAMGLSTASACCVQQVEDTPFPASLRWVAEQADDGICVRNGFEREEVCAAMKRIVPPANVACIDGDDAAFVGALASFGLGATEGTVPCMATSEGAPVNGLVARGMHQCGGEAATAREEETCLDDNLDTCIDSGVPLGLNAIESMGPGVGALCTNPANGAAAQGAYRCGCAASSPDTGGFSNDDGPSVLQSTHSLFKHIDHWRHPATGHCPASSAQEACSKTVMAAQQQVGTDIETRTGRRPEHGDDGQI